MFFLYFDLRSDPELDPDFLPAVPDPDPWKKCWILIPANKEQAMGNYR